MHVDSSITSTRLPVEIVVDMSAKGAVLTHSYVMMMTSVMVSQRVDEGRCELDDVIENERVDADGE